MNTLLHYPDSLLAICVWREARNQSNEAKLGVVWVIRNRAANPKAPYAGRHDVWSNIMAPLQFSSFNRNDPNASLLPAPGDSAFPDCCAAVDSGEPDPTNGATHYHSFPAGHQDWPIWATPDKLTATIGAFKFYKL